MAAGKINLQKASGGVTTITGVDGAGNTEVVLPESGTLATVESPTFTGTPKIGNDNIASISTAVADNAIARYDGTTGKLQNSNAIIDDTGNLLLISGTGALGYGAEAGGTVTQLTSKSTNVTLNKPSGRIQTHSSELIAGANVVFEVNNSLVTITDNVAVDWDSSNYKVEGYACTSGKFVIRITNVTSTPRSESLSLNFTVIRGSVS